MVPDPIFTSTHAITIDAPTEQVWPWIVQMGSGRAGWYSWDAIDNGGTPSSTSIMPAFQTVIRGDIMPAIPGAKEAFVVATVDPPRDLVLTVPDGHGGNLFGWEHVLDPLPGGRTRLIVRGRMSSRWVDIARTAPDAGHRILIERAYAVLARLPRPLLIAFAALGHRIMEARHLRGIQRRSVAASAGRAVSHEGWRGAFLGCGIVSSLLYGTMIWAIRCVPALGRGAGDWAAADPEHIRRNGCPILLRSRLQRVNPGIPLCRHVMCVSQHGIVDAPVLHSLKKKRAGDHANPAERFVA